MSEHGWTEADLDRADHLRAERNERGEAVVARISEHYYVLRLPAGREIGGTTRSSLERYARQQGLTAQYRDERKPELKAKTF